MRILIFGASGPTGRLLVDQALAAGHKVTAVTRRPDAIEERDRLAVVVADATDPDAVLAVMPGHGAVLSVLGATLSRKPVSLYSRAAANITAAMRQHGVRRLVAVSSSVTDPAWRPSGEFFFNTVLDPLVNRRLGRTVHDDMRRMEALIRGTDLDWTIVRASGLFSHPEVTDYLVEPDSADGVFTARTDLAAGMLAQLDDDRFVRATAGVVTTAVRPRISQLIRRELLGR
jgi:uncharacterized protein YbjT (DUF2867 family)